MISVNFHDAAWNELLWYAKNDSKLLAKIVELIESIKSTPFSGLGKPEPLKGNLKGYWSRRITQEHRLVYKIEPDTIIILFAKGHYLHK